jgi:hypothetical protein
MSGQRVTQIVWDSEDQAHVDFGIESETNIPQAGRFGRVGAALGGANGANGASGQTQDVTDILRRLDRLERLYNQLRLQSSTVKIFYDLLDEDTNTNATVNTWTDLPGLSRTIAVNLPSLAYVSVQLTLKCDEMSGVDAATCQARILINDNELDGRFHWGETDSHMLLPGKKDRGVCTIHGQAVLRLDKGTNYTIKVQFTNAGDTTTYTAKAGGAGIGSDSNMVILLVLGTMATFAPRITPSMDGHSWSRIIDFSYDRTNDRVYALRVRGEWDDVRPAASVIEASTPDRAYIEAVYYAYTDLPITATSGGTLAYRRKLADPANWQDYYSLFFAVRHNSTEMALCYSSNQQGATAYSRKYFFAMVDASGAEAKYESWDGPNWLDDINGYSTRYGSAVWDATDLYAVMPTTDTSARSGSRPYKSGWRLVRKRSCAVSGTTTAGNRGTTISSIDLLPDAGNDAKTPICLVTDDATAKLIYREDKYPSGVDIKIATAANVIAGNPPSGAAVINMGGFVPDAGQSVQLWRNDSPYVYIFIRQGYSDIYTWPSGGSTTYLWSDEVYNLGLWDYSKFDVQSTPTNKIIVFRRGAQGDNLSIPWIKSIATNQPINSYSYGTQ